MPWKPKGVVIPWWNGGRLALVCTNPTVLRLFEITRLDTTFDIRPTREEAIASVRGDYDDGGAGSSAGAP